MPVKEPYLNYWYRALSTSHGIEVACSDAASARAHLYQVRKEAKDADLEQIALTISPFDPTRLWLKRKSTDATP